MPRLDTVLRETYEKLNLWPPKKEGTRVAFYEELARDAIERGVRFALDLEDTMGERPFGWDRMSQVQRLEWLRQKMESDPNLVQLYSTVGWDNLLKMIDEKDRLEGKFASP